MTKNIRLRPLTHEIQDGGRRSYLAVKLAHLFAANRNKESAGRQTSQCANAEMLRKRYLLGTMRDYTRSADEAEMALLRLYKQMRQGQLGIYVDRAEDDSWVVLSSVQPARKIRRHRPMPLIPLLARRPFVEPVRTRGPYVEAVIATERPMPVEKIVSSAYNQLADSRGVAKDMYRAYAQSRSLTASESLLAWTVEPLDAPDLYRRALERAGFVPAGHGYYDYETARWETPPLSTFYEATPSGPAFSTSSA